jgi:hypothetical protein
MKNYISSTSKIYTINNNCKLHYLTYNNKEYYVTEIFNWGPIGYKTSKSLGECYIFYLYN